MRVHVHLIINFSKPWLACVVHVRALPCFIHCIYHIGNSMKKKFHRDENRYNESIWHIGYDALGFEAIDSKVPSATAQTDRLHRVR